MQNAINVDGDDGSLVTLRIKPETALQEMYTPPPGSSKHGKTLGDQIMHDEMTSQMQAAEQLFVKMQEALRETEESHAKRTRTLSEVYETRLAALDPDYDKSNSPAVDLSPVSCDSPGLPMESPVRHRVDAYVSMAEHCIKMKNPKMARDAISQGLRLDKRR